MKEHLPAAPKYRVEVVAKDFFMPQLGRTRRIWIYLPASYTQDSSRRFPVLYLQDGQNVFDTSTSFAGEWFVDESLDILHQQGDPGAIVVGIDNGAELRMNEYSPWAHPKFGGGEGAEYTRFIVETLKPYIDRHYRTLPDREHTGIMGSSMGGLISLYAVVEYQEVFGRAGVFSPSLWFSREIFSHVLRTGNTHNPKIFLAMGKLEGPRGVRDVERMYKTLLRADFLRDHIKMVIHPDGKHQEWYWAREFPVAYQWLFNRETNAP